MYSVIFHLCTHMLIPPILNDPLDSYQTGGLVAGVVVGNNQVCPFLRWDMRSTVSSARSSLFQRLGDRTDTAAETEKSQEAVKPESSDGLTFV